MNYKIGEKINKKILDKDVEVVISNIEVEEQGIYLDEGSYTKEEIEDILSESPIFETKVYGKIVNKKDIKALEGLQDIVEKSMHINVTGFPYQREDFKNEILLEVFRNGDEPEY